MALKIRLRSRATVFAALLAATAVAAVSLGAADASAQQPKKKYYGPVRGYSTNPNYSYMSGPRTRVYVTRRSWLDAGTEVLPGERKFTDYAFPPGYNYNRNFNRLNQGRNPLSDTPYDLGGYPAAFPLY